MFRSVYRICPNAPHFDSNFQLGKTRPYPNVPLAPRDAPPCYPHEDGTYYTTVVPRKTFIIQYTYPIPLS